MFFLQVRHSTRAVGRQNLARVPDALLCLIRVLNSLEEKGIFSILRFECYRPVLLFRNLKKKLVLPSVFWTSNTLSFISMRILIFHWWPAEYCNQFRRLMIVSKYSECILFSAVTSWLVVMVVVVCFLSCWWWLGFLFLLAGYDCCGCCFSNFVLMMFLLLWSLFLLMFSHWWCRCGGCGGCCFCCYFNASLL
jgi:hypothetical protein